MTTLELIERGIGHNCLSDAYDLGRADKYQEITSEYMLLTEKQVAEIKTDAVEECIQAIEDTKCLFDNTTKWTMGQKDHLQNVLRKLKEQT